MTYPVYFLQLGDERRIVFSQEDIGHTDFWEQIVSHIVAKHFGIPPNTIANLPYCQRRGRVVGNMVYYGERPDPELLRLLREAARNEQLVFCHDEHEKRLRQDVRQFRRLVKRASR
jgi:hypothetical protein